MKFDVRPWFVLLAPLACSHATERSAKQVTEADRAAIAAVIDSQAAVARRAWEQRDASLLIPDTTQGAVRETPEGSMTDAAMMRADLQRRMDMTVRVDTMLTMLDSIRVVGTDSALVYSSQRFVRVMRPSETEERQRKSTVTHEQLFLRRSGRWEAVGPIREIDPRAWWADGPEPPRL